MLNNISLNTNIKIEEVATFMTSVEPENSAKCQSKIQGCSFFIVSTVTTSYFPLNAYSTFSPLLICI